MKGKMAVLGVAVALLLVVVQVQAHHPFDTEYDADKPITLKGTVTKVEWGNPHVSISLDAKDAAGAVTNWTFELGPPSRLKNFAWKKDTLKAGEEITVNGWRRRDGSNQGSANMITLADGTKMVGGSSFFDRRPAASN